MDACTDPGTGTWSDSARRTLFADWYGREEELFLHCAEAIIQNKNNLFEIAGQQKLRQTPGYDAAQRERLGSRFESALIAEALPEGEAVSIRSLWYGTQLAHRNLQLHRLKASSTESSD
jgi:hypothetical protein